MRQQEGFTVVELAVVIVVIAILATISIVTYQGAQTRAKATAIAAGIKQIEDGFRTYLVTSNMTEFPRDTDFTGASNPNFAAMAAANPTFAGFVATDGASGSWTYDNDKDTRLESTCVANDWAAVNIGINVTPAVAQAVDNAIDDGNLSCGRVRSGSATAVSITYKLSFDQKH